MSVKIGRRHENEARGNGKKTVRTTKTATTAEQCVATDAITTC